MPEHHPLRVTHVHTDPKFVYLTEVFDKTVFDNTVVIIDGKRSSSEMYCDQVVVFSSNTEDLKKAIQFCTNADIVVLYDLDALKSYIAIHLPQSTVVAWRFFGYELYGRRVESYLSEKSLPLHWVKKKAASKSLKAFISQIKFKLAYGYSLDELFANAVRRADLLLCLSKYEYDHLIKYWHDLPRFVQWPTLEFPSLEPITIYENAQNRVIIIGNNRGIYNNHLDVIDLIEHSSCDEQLKFLVPFSYGSETPYSSEVRRRISNSHKDFFLLENFLAKDAYFELIAKAQAAVFNSYRQMAMGNIFTLLGSGVKVYLNTSNIIYYWLKDLGLKVFSIEDFKLDLESGKLELNLIDKQINANVLERLKSDFTQEKFANDIIAVLKEKAEHHFLEGI